VVGMTNNGKYQTIGEDAQPFFYVPPRKTSHRNAFCTFARSFRLN
jgi:hypothetical protein